MSNAIHSDTTQEYEKNNQTDYNMMLTALPATDLEVERYLELLWHEETGEAAKTAITLYRFNRQAGQSLLKAYVQVIVLRLPTEMRPSREWIETMTT